MIYNKADARMLLYNFSRAYPTMFKGRIESAILKIEVALKAIKSDELRDDPLFVYPLYDYDFTAHCLVQCSEGTPSSISGNSMLQAKAIRDYLMERAKVLAQECSVPIIPFAVKFTTTYLQAKLLRDSGCQTPEEYVNKDNIVHFGNRFRSFLQTVGERFIARPEKQLVKDILIEKHNIQRISAAMYLPPDDAKHALLSVLLIPSIPLVIDTFEPFVEFSINTKKFAFFVKPFLGDRVIIDMPNHNLFFFESLRAKSLCSIRGAGIFVFNNVSTEIPGRCVVHAEDEVVIFSDETPHRRACSLVGHPVRILESEETVEFAKLISSETKKSIQTDAFTFDFAMACLKSTAKHVFYNIPFEYVRQKFSFPIEMTVDDLEDDLNINIRPILNYYNIPLIGRLETIARNLFV